ncbi:GNAT family N-acetyltransferase [Chloroflexota bacterium]
MGYGLTQETFASISAYANNPDSRLNWPFVFVLPAWLRAWWQEFGSGNELYLTSARQGEQVIGIAPLLVKDGEASFIGSPDICDYLDFIIAPNRESDFFAALLDNLKQQGIKHLDLKSLRPDSTVLTHLVPLAKSLNYAVHFRQEDVSLELDLPASWEEYLALLGKKQRHEIRRKLRRLWGEGDLNYCCVEAGAEVDEYMSSFLKFFALSRGEKADFMTGSMESFFRSMARAMAELGLLRFGIVGLGKVPAAITMCFDYGDTMYLYNSAYDPEHNSLSVGLLSKVLGIKDSIQQGRKRWDFLKGSEAYKYHIGGREIPLYNCQIWLK